MPPISKWFVITNVPIPSLASLAEPTELDDLRVYHRGPEGARLSGEPPFLLDVATAAPCERPTEGATTIVAAPGEVEVRTSHLNENPVYYAANRVRGRFAYFTDLFLAPLVLPALDLPVELTEAQPLEGSPLLGVQRLKHGLTARTRRARGHWLTEAVEEPDPLGGFGAPHRDDPMAAGEDQLDALSAEIREIDTSSPKEAAYATLLSGGIDSGTVTYLAAASGLPVTPYSVGTPWGDELDDAAELCAELGTDLVPIHLTEDQIIASVPEAVRWLGVTEPETVEVALTATAVQRLGAIPGEQVLLTGYGSDLMNAGLYRPFTHRDDLMGQVLAAIDATRYSNELSNRMPLAYGTTTHHPFWSWRVMRVALETAPECKIREGREKFHLRTAMARRVPEPIAWRRKIAVHHGGGLQDGVADRLEKETGTAERRGVYLACLAELLERAKEGELEPTDPWKVLEGAFRRVRAG